ncbi:MAG TPA: hypothetical protein VGU19_11165, partial [Microvirga sp.]|nr:hypothetical protein [Microvirga sp.]
PDRKQVSLVGKPLMSVRMMHFMGLVQSDAAVWRLFGDEAAIPAITRNTTAPRMERSLCCIGDMRERVPPRPSRR